MLNKIIFKSNKKYLIVAILLLQYKDESLIKKMFFEGIWLIEKEDFEIKQLLYQFVIIN